MVRKSSGQGVEDLHSLQERNKGLRSPDFLCVCAIFHKANFTYTDSQQLLMMCLLLADTLENNRGVDGA